GPILMLNGPAFLFQVVADGVAETWVGDPVQLYCCVTEDGLFYVPAIAISMGFWTPCWKGI
ncbi:MAG: hypothetical protein AAF361_08130, partial [Bacteroidota bacterium]